MALIDDPKVQNLVEKAKAEAHQVAAGIVAELSKVHVASAAEAGEKAAVRHVKEFARSLKDQIIAARDAAKDAAKAARDASRS